MSATMAKATAIMLIVSHSRFQLDSICIRRFPGFRDVVHRRTPAAVHWHARPACCRALPPQHAWYQRAIGQKVNASIEAGTSGAGYELDFLALDRMQGIIDIST